MNRLRGFFLTYCYFVTRSNGKIGPKTIHFWAPAAKWVRSHTTRTLSLMRDDWEFLLFPEMIK